VNILFNQYYYPSCNQAERSSESISYSSKKEITAKQRGGSQRSSAGSKAGIEAMKNGGNAFDAAIATQLTLAVVYPGAGNIGGGGFMVARLQSGDLVSLDFRETAPAAAHKKYVSRLRWKYY
jgi:gamma-glutamyltranspeptidase/glutathione hydrolase